MIFSDNFSFKTSQFKQFCDDFFFNCDWFLRGSKIHKVNYGAKFTMFFESKICYIIKLFFFEEEIIKL